MRYAIFFCLLLSTVSMVSWAADPPDAMHYTGVLRDAADNPIEGTVSMVFRFHDAQTGGNEILVDSHGAVLVTLGLFDAALGTAAVSDGAGPGTYLSLLDMFRDFDDVWLQIQVNGETLTPRVQVASAAYALNARTVRGHEVTTGAPLDLYVDLAMPDDSGDGLSPATAKATIQAALDLIPTILHHDVVVHVVSGTYSESLVLRDRLAPGGASITLLRDPAVNSVIVSGSGTARHAIELSDVTNVVIDGFSFRDATSSSVFVTDGGDVTLHEVEVKDNYLGVLAIRSQIVLDNVYVTNSTTTGVFCSSTSRCRILDLTSTFNSYGILAARAAQVRFEGPTTLTNNLYGGQAQEAASLDFMYRSDITVAANSGDSLIAREHGRVMRYGSAFISPTGCVAYDYSLCSP